MNILKKTTNSPKQTFDIGFQLLKLIPNDTNLILINGDLGSGKTIFVKGIAKYLGIKEEIVSPTYGYKNIYNNMIHYDFYLLKNEITKEVLYQITEEIDDNLVVVEWGKKIPKIKGTIFVDIKIIKDSERLITIRIL